MRSAKIAVGSKNPVKVDSARLAFEALWPDAEFEVVGVKASSGVSDQPMSDEESVKGARARAQQSLEVASADFGVGIEGGLHRHGDTWLDCGWVVVRAHDGAEGMGSTLRMHVPDKVMEMIHAGKELGDAMDHFFSRKNSKQAEGHFGLFTKNAVTRTSAYRDGVVSALARFVQTDLYN